MSLSGHRDIRYGVATFQRSSIMVEARESCGGDGNTSSVNANTIIVKCECPLVRNEEDEVVRYRGSLPRWERGRR